VLIRYHFYYLESWEWLSDNGNYSTVSNEDPEFNLSGMPDHFKECLVQAFGIHVPSAVLVEHDSHQPKEISIATPQDEGLERLEWSALENNVDHNASKLFVDRSHLKGLVFPTDPFLFFLM